MWLLWGSLTKTPFIAFCCNFMVLAGFDHLRCCKYCSFCKNFFSNIAFFPAIFRQQLQLIPINKNVVNVVCLIFNNNVLPFQRIFWGKGVLLSCFCESKMFVTKWHRQQLIAVYTSTDNPVLCGERLIKEVKERKVN